MIKTTTIISLVVCSIVILSLSNCKPEEMVQKKTECTAANTVKFPQDALDRFYFKNGTYWVYQDSATGNIDSAWVRNARLETHTPNGYGGDICYDYRYYRLVTDYYKDSFLVWIIPNNVSDKIQDTASMYFDITYNLLKTNKSNTYYRFNSYFNYYDSTNQHSGKIQILKQVTLNNKTYNNCLLLYYPNSIEDIYKYAYYAKNIGLVKYQLKNGSVWKLIRYNIIQ
ncbi:MAG: hypothetical protein HQ463_01250 [Bacteroidetes bacterium]|nr:hypothetical protein [Bacteroidota bacterium]